MAAGSGGSGGSGGGPGPGPGGGGGPGGSGAGSGSGGGLGSGGELHPRTGRLVSLSACGRTARRQQPGQEFNHGLVLSREPLRDGRVFTVRIDRKVRSGARGTEMWRVVGGGERETRSSSTARPAHIAGYREGTDRPGHRVTGRRGAWSRNLRSDGERDEENWSFLKTQEQRSRDTGLRPQEWLGTRSPGIISGRWRMEGCQGCDRRRGENQGKNQPLEDKLGRKDG